MTPTKNRPIFVFGSNLAGIHGAGAALHAKKYYGAKIGVGRGLTGNSYALPTKDENIMTLPLDVIERNIVEFFGFAEDNPAKSFALTPIGTGLAGYKRSQMMEIISRHDIPENVFFTRHWFPNHKYTVDKTHGMK